MPKIKRWHGVNPRGHWSSAWFFCNKDGEETEVGAPNRIGISSTLATFASIDPP